MTKGREDWARQERFCYEHHHRTGADHFVVRPRRSLAAASALALPAASASAFVTSRPDLGCGATLPQPFPAPTAKIPISVRPLVEADLPVLLAVDDATSPEDQYEIACRRALADQADRRRLRRGRRARRHDPVTSNGCSARPTMTSSGGSRASRTLPPTRRCLREPTPRPAIADWASCPPPWG